MKRVALLAGFLAVMGLQGCGGGGSADDSSSGGAGTLQLKIADAPVDQATSVVVQFSGVEVQPGSGDRININFSKPKEIDLLKLTGGASAVLLDATTVPSGHYEWVRLKVNAEPGVRDSYIVVEDGEHELRIPSGAESGLKLNRGFDVPAGGTADFTIDFDLRKSVHQPSSGKDYMLRPTLRIVDNVEVGSISGTVAPALLTGAGCDGGAVYVYTGSGATPDDVGGKGTQPVTTAWVTQNASGQYTYKAAFLSAGAYTVALTCQAKSDDPATDDPISFAGTADVSVTAGGNTVHDF